MPEEASWNGLKSLHPCRIRRTRRSGNIIRYSHSIWSVTDDIEYTFPRTQNVVEAWHRRWNTLVGHAHIGVFKIIKEIQYEQNQVENNIESILRGAHSFYERN
ncbi:uncharacterized protein OCT59_017969 [Rhizophagus irregularis]|uniref:Uncharacterized protein n=1 Tax=Rhizophagus irregularis (strain DAOM 181602 / DAOM 197198 / MUCL 43194) TaxID=747089 RepID=A0A2P4QR26_RHIID|nr:hypothetical protein GLOIN_2v386834 [Rhizophagus irregularis DAOM 181602=DAOM 197198]UZO25707.1 hypothetical protein OCT59_017969 [Rhizophagus irregularis]POG80062.1 hypothetical protein GLOIN_2v386834 [Rhizophagus irregularis DAOM 181602=DAOM 197198]CAB4475935.1 unnamed protein product [Rhizophagus irregularis]CAB5188280.1 unnamed protein product [Rhizophagus irregularis]GET54589.1 hypothetical protein GLOIN_2v386834 [Rhizophagus irregularis DAOM 181602=DAOM 197198]|eukprot:XP_025186928.1 hypothetical protein GLOIN_2v386834 [Rhizophagus irregularis DAOM 181602=DAOM 197198]